MTRDTSSLRENVPVDGEGRGLRVALLAIFTTLDRSSEDGADEQREEDREETHYRPYRALRYLFDRRTTAIRIWCTYARKLLLIQNIDAKV